MVTIKDIAKYAGVAQGTVSNVLNGKGNVSSEKIKLVMDAALTLGYIPNERAKFLRKGQSNLLGVILPNLRSKQYIDFYLSFKHYAESQNYSVLLELNNDNNRDTEINAIQQLRSYMACGIATFTCFKNKNEITPYDIALDSSNSTNNILFVERKPDFSDVFIGFDYKKAGQELAKKAVEKNYHSICLLTGSLALANELDFYNGFMEIISKSTCYVNHVQTDIYRQKQNIIHIFNGKRLEAIFISNYGFAESVKDIYSSFHNSEKQLPIYAVSPLFTLPENDFIKYELNYSKLGNAAAKKLIKIISTPSSSSSFEILKETGFRDWFSHLTINMAKHPLHVLTLDDPSSYALQHLAHLYTKKTGVPVHISIYSYNEIYEAFNAMNKDSIFDILRLDVTWLSWFAEKILQPLEQIDSTIVEDMHSFIPNLSNHYSYVNGKLYCLPMTPSMQLLFYRKDLFESPVLKRTYWEQYKESLSVPCTFKEFNKVARFFTRAFNPDSPVQYGATLTLGSTGVASSEYLSRLFSHQKNLYNTENIVQLDSKTSIEAMQELIDLKDFSTTKNCNWWTDTASTFSEGDVAMAILYSNFASEILKSSSKVIGNIGFTLPPGNNPPIGGGALGISKYTEHPREALSFIRWICSEPVASAGTLLGSVSPCMETYDNYDITNYYPWLNLVKNSFNSVNGRRVPPSKLHPFDERKFLSILGMAVKNSLSGAQTIKEALSKAQKLYQESFD